VQNVIIPIWTPSIADLMRSDFNHSIASVNPYCTQVLFQQNQKSMAELLIIQQIFSRAVFQRWDAMLYYRLIATVEKIWERHMALC